MSCDESVHGEIFSRLNEVTKGLAETSSYVKAVVDQNDKLISLIKWALGASFIVTMFCLGALVFSKTGSDGVKAALDPLKAISSHDGTADLRNFFNGRRTRWA